METNVEINIPMKVELEVKMAIVSGIHPILRLYTVTLLTRQRAILGRDLSPNVTGWVTKWI